jgi:hypothetical protein
MIIERRARNASAAVSILVTAAVSACATTTPSAPDTDKQKKVRSDLEQCNTVAGGKVQSMTVSPDGKYSFQVVGRPTANTVLECMTSKGYSGSRTDNPIDHGTAEMIRSGGHGQPLK